MGLPDIILGTGKTGVYAVRRQDAGAFDIDGRWYAGPSALVFADDAVEVVDDVADTLTLTAHGLETADGPVRLTTTGTLPGGLAPGTDYWVIVDDDDTVAIAASLADAIAGTRIAIADAGTGAHALVDVAGTLRQNATFFSSVMSIQSGSPGTGRALKENPEGDHGDEVWKIYSTVELRTRTSENEPDEITIEGETHYVTDVRVRRGFGTVHWQAQTSRRKVNNP